MIMAMLVGIESDVVTDGTAPSIYRYPQAELLLYEVALEEDHPSTAPEGRPWV